MGKEGKSQMCGSGLWMSCTSVHIYADDMAGGDQCFVVRVSWCRRTVYLGWCGAQSIAVTCEHGLMSFT
jgi:hypothetical protein